MSDDILESLDADTSCIMLSVARALLLEAALAKAKLRNLAPNPGSLENLSMTLGNVIAGIEGITPISQSEILEIAEQVVAAQKITPLPGRSSVVAGSRN